MLIFSPKGLGGMSNQLAITVKPYTQTRLRAETA